MPAQSPNTAHAAAQPGVASPLSVAGQAAVRILRIGRDLALLNAELQTRQQLQRASLGAVWLVLTFVFGTLALAFSAFWFLSALRENGWSSLSLALLSAGGFGLLTGVSGALGWRLHAKGSKDRPSPFRAAQVDARRSSVDPKTRASA